MNERISVENKIKENKRRFFFAVVVILVSISLLILIVSLLFRNTNINQGKFRVLDAVITSGATLEDTSGETGKWTYNISQSNILSLLVNFDFDEHVNAYITNITCDNPNVIMSQVNAEDIYAQSNNDQRLDLTSLKDGNTILYEINVINKNVLSMYEIPYGINEIKHDATIFKLAKMTTKDLKFNIKFDFNIQESNGKINTMHVNLALPQGDIVENSNMVTKPGLSNFVFRSK